MLGVRHSVLLDDAFRWQVGDGSAEPVSAHVVAPGQAVPAGQAKIRYLRGWGGRRVGGDQIRRVAALLGRRRDTDD